MSQIYRNYHFLMVTLSTIIFGIEEKMQGSGGKLKTCGQGAGTNIPGVL